MQGNTATALHWKGIHAYICTRDANGVLNWVAPPIPFFKNYQLQGFLYSLSRERGLPDETPRHILAAFDRTEHSFGASWMTLDEMQAAAAKYGTDTLYVVLGAMRGAQEYYANHGGGEVIFVYWLEG